MTLHLEGTRLIGHQTESSEPRNSFSDHRINPLNNDDLVCRNPAHLAPINGTNDNHAETAASDTHQISDAIGPIAAQLGRLLASREARLAVGGVQ